MNIKSKPFLSLIYEQRIIRRSVVIHIILWLTLAMLMSKFILIDQKNNISPFGISIQTEGPGSPYSKITINDMASIINFVNRTWLGQTTVNLGASIYSVNNHLKVTSEWAGKKVNHSLSFGYSPTMLWILGPLVFIPHFLAFYIFDLIGLVAVWWITHPSRCRLGFGLLAFFSPLAIVCFDIGQTALLTGTGLLYIAEKTKDENCAASWRIPVITGSALWALTAKPPLALTAVFVLLCLRRWRPLLVAAVLTIISTLAITPILGPNWVYDYLHLITSHNQINSGPAFAWSHFPSHMANLRGILSVDFGIRDDIASRVSASAWLVSLACIAAVRIRAKLSEGALWSLAILAYLLFCPHVTSTEILQLVLLIPLCVSVQNDLTWQELLFLVVVPLLPFASPAVGMFAGNRLVLFAANIFLATIILSYSKPWAKDADSRP